VRPLHIAIALAAVLLVTGCGDERPRAAGRSDSTVSATPAPAPAPTPVPPTPIPTAAAPTGPLAAFPLDLGYGDENGDDHSPVVVTDRPGLGRFGYCDDIVWDPHAGTEDLIGVEFSGEGEWARGRTLVLYPSVAAAEDAVSAARAAIARCPEEPPDERGDSTAHTLLDVRLGDQAVVWIDRFHSAEAGGFDTGLVVYHLVRVGRVVLGSYEYGEGNGSDRTREQSIAVATDADRPLVEPMRDLPSAPGPAG
jgi:hypothetical protein